MNVRPEKRDRVWLMRYLQRKPALTGRVGRYLAVIRAADQPVDLSDPGPGEAHRDVAYLNSRQGAAMLARRAFLLHIDSGRCCADVERLASILAGLHRFEEQQDRQGRFVWGDGHYHRWGAHEQGWRLEPIVYARIWLDRFLSAGDKRWLDRVIERGGRFMLSAAKDDPTCNLQYNNRGLVWCAVTQLCGLYLDDGKYLRAVNRQADAIFDRVLDAQGQVKEATLQYLGGGPDANYTYTGWTYAMHYRLMSGRRDLDDRLVAAVRWLVRTNTRSGHHLIAGASVRQARYPIAKVSDVYPALESYTAREPVFDRVIERWWSTAKNRNGHCVHPFVWAMLAHQPLGRPVADTAADFEDHYVNPPCEYAVVRHRYQTAVVYRGIHPLKGIQTFAWADEEPIILHTTEQGSGTRAGRCDTGVYSVDGTDSGWEIFTRRAGAGDGYEAAQPCTCVVTRRGRVWELYAFTPASVLYLVGGADNLRTRWVLHESADSPVTIDRKRRRVQFAGRDGKLTAGPRATLSISRTKDVTTLHATHRTSPAVFALGGPGTCITAVDRRNQTVDLTDPSGRYRISFADMLTADGRLNRRPWRRVKQ